IHRHARRGCCVARGAGCLSRRLGCFGTERHGRTRRGGLMTVVAVERIAADAALSLRGVSAGYDRHVVLHDVDLDVARGGGVALLGPNGAGKTTLLNVASGLLRPTAGTVRLNEH